MENLSTRRVWAEINMAAAERNLEKLRGFLREDRTKPACVIKADGYGHGAVPLMRLYQNAGVDFFCVASVPEALELRENGCAGDILILSSFEPELSGVLAENDIIGTVVSPEHARQVSDRALSPVRVHIKLDTGMNRVGLDTREPERCAESIAEIASLPGISAEGVFTHFAAADSLAPEDTAFTDLQKDRFFAAINAAEELGVTFPHKHFLNSAGTLFHYDSRSTLARLGIVLYGLKPDCALKLPVTLEPVMSLKTVVSQVKTVKAGDSVSYGRTYTADTDRVIATVPCGYADGYFRALSGKCEALVHGKRVPGVGRICMDQMMFDVTNVDDVKSGDEVVLIGTQEGETITADDVAYRCGTIGYEIVCAVSKRVPRAEIKE